MKRKTLLVLLFIFSTIDFFAQPQKISYQAIIRDNLGNIITNQDITLQVDILQGSATGTTVYSEQHDVTTNQYGLVNLFIGTGSVISGSMEDIDWANGPYFLKTSIDIGNGLQELGTQEIVSVPYSLYSKKADTANVAYTAVALSGPYDDSNTNELQILEIHGDTLFISNGNYVLLTDNDPTNEIQTLSISNDTLYLSNGNSVYLNSLAAAGSNGNIQFNNNGQLDASPSLYWDITKERLGIGTNTPQGRVVIQQDPAAPDSLPLFEVKDKDGNPVFVVYPDSVHVFIPLDSSKSVGHVGGFAVSGRVSTKGTSVPYLYVTPDSTRIYFETPANKSVGHVGGFAVSGRVSTKAGEESDYLVVTSDSTRIYFDEDNAKSVGHVGGFAVSGRVSTKAGEGNEYFVVSPNDTAGIINPSEPRIYWYPNKEAFLTGRVLVESPDSVGTNSFVTGYESKAIGNYSQALGYQARAIGNNSMAIGYKATSEGNNSYAFGNFAVARDSGCYAIGSGAKALGFRSFALGSTGVDSAGNATSPAIAYGDYSYAIGTGAISDGMGSFAIGIEDTSFGYGAFSIGYRTRAFGYYSLALGGYSIAEDDGATALGYNCKATSGATALGTGSKALGYGSFAAGGGVARGYHSVAIGPYCHADTTWSIAIGSDNIADSIFSVAFGNGNLASGIGAVVFGKNNEIYGEFSMSVGLENSVEATYSIVSGNSNFTSGGFNSIFGRYNNITGQYLLVSGDYNTTTNNTSYSVIFGHSNNATGDFNYLNGNSIDVSGDYNFIQGVNITANVSTDFQFVMGEDMQATDSYTIAIGKNDTVMGLHSIAIGSSNFANSPFSMSIGQGNKTFNNYGITIGSMNVNTGYQSLSLGHSNEIRGDNSFAIGYTDTISSMFSMLFGNYLKSSVYGATVLGYYNYTDPSWHENGWYNDEPILIVGNGYWDRHNAMVILKNGFVGINTNNPDKMLTVEGDARITGDIYYGPAGNTDIYNKPDFVFTPEYDKDYSIGYIEKYIKKHGHLPWVTAAKDEKNGINMTRLSFETLEAVENQQLQIIKLKKENEALKNMIKELEKRIEKLEKQSK